MWHLWWPLSPPLPAAGHSEPLLPTCSSGVSQRCGRMAWGAGVPSLGLSLPEFLHSLWYLQIPDFTFLILWAWKIAGFVICAAATCELFSAPGPEPPRRELIRIIPSSLSHKCELPTRVRMLLFAPGTFGWWVSCVRSRFCICFLCGWTERAPQ